MVCGDKMLLSSVLVYGLGFRLIIECQRVVVLDIQFVGLDFDVGGCGCFEWLIVLYVFYD